MRLWAENVPGFSGLVWNVDLPQLRYGFAIALGLGKDTTLHIMALRNAPRTITGSLEAQPPRIIEGTKVEEWQAFSLELSEAGRITFDPAMRKLKRPPK